MTDGYIKADPTAWARAVNELKVARDTVDERSSKMGLVRVRRAEQALLNLAAPDLSAVAEKLMIVWQYEIWDETAEGRQLQMIVGDLRRLEATGPGARECQCTGGGR